jgi:hypothetical protein
MIANIEQKEFVSLLFMPVSSFRYKLMDPWPVLKMTV